MHTKLDQGLWDFGTLGSAKTRGERARKAAGARDGSRAETRRRGGEEKELRALRDREPGVRAIVGQPKEASGEKETREREREKK